ncbi:MAG: hypothetical protein JWQ10_4160 [Herbaspirillum sp.]|nr:hypothetical protein [Herbaspirillum sp.]
MVAKTSKKPATNKKTITKVPPLRSSRLSQEDVPSYHLSAALAVGTAIIEQYGGKTVSPLDVAVALNLSPQSSGFRMLCGAAIAYGITAGGYNAKEISVTDLGKRILTPLEEGGDLLGRKEALMRPRIFREFLNKYDRSPLPRTDIAVNVLKSMGVPADRAEAVLKLVTDSADEVGFLRIVKDKKYVDLSSQDSDFVAPASLENETDASALSTGSVQPRPSEIALPAPAAPELKDHNIDLKRRRVFITHGKNTAFIDPIKKLLGFGELIPVVSVENQSVSQPVPDKVMNDMRTCGAAIIHVDGELLLAEKDQKAQVVINSNVLIEIGAAMALYGYRFILLVRDGIVLPSNLQGLYQVRYVGETLDGNATIRLMEAINNIKNNKSPAIQEAA